jgi:DNA-binding response OmpR family regulator
MNILIVEDDIFLSERIGKIFGSKVISNRIKILHSYDEFINEIPILSSYDIVLTDLKLSGEGSDDLNGYKIIRIVREHLLHIPVVVISGFSDIEKLRYAFECGASDYIIKPIRLHELEIRVLNWFKNHYLLGIRYNGRIHYYGDL